ncbi:MAG: DNA polymerase/3'-5' exonuclease PolX [Thermodesulfobacteriota bacterium]
MENSEIARIFDEIADMLEIKGGDRFRIRSYRNAAMVVEGLSESLRGLYGQGEGRLEGIPGIGQSTRAKIMEMLDTGRCAYHDELAREVPPGMLEVIKISGVGPKKASMLHRELGIKDVAGLEKAAAQGRLRGLQGFGEVTERKILKGIADLRSFAGRFKLSEASHWAQVFVSAIKGLPGVGEVVPAGSLRRWKETVGDIDILVTCDEPGPVMERFTTHPDVKDVVSRGGTRSTVKLGNGLQADIRVVGERSFGAALQYFTGSKAHNVAIRDMAKRKGLKINEYGVFDENEGDRWIAGRSEEEVYASVGLPWISPELREKRGELEAAADNRLPDLVEVSDIKGELHLHTKDSDGGATLEEMAQAAMDRGYAYMAVTDHSKAVAVAHGLDEKRALRQIEEIDEFNSRLKKRRKRFVVLKGTEVDIKADGTLDHPEGLLKRLDCVVASVHSGFGMPMEQMTERIVKAIRTGLVNIIGHPTGRLIGARPPYQVDMERVIEEAARYGVAMEVNAYPERLDLNDVHCRLAKEKGVVVAISTDAHAPYHLENIVYGVHTARRGWIEKADVLNSRPLKGLLEFLRKG